MKKKINKSKVLLVLAILLGIIYGISTLFTEETHIPFAANLIQIDTNQVSSIILYPKADHFEKITLLQQQSEWLISKGNFTTKANAAKVSTLLKDIQLIKSQQIVAKNPDKWAMYAVKPNKASRIQVYTNGQLQEDFLLGNYAFSQKEGTTTSYIRLSDENEVYAIDGLLSKNLSQGFDTYRNKVILNNDPSKWSSIEVLNASSLDTLVKKGEAWMLKETTLDSLPMTNYINGLDTISGIDFVNNFDPFNNSRKLTHQIKLFSNNQIEPIVISCYIDTLRTKPFIIHSNMNKDAYFASDSLGIYQRLFKNMGEFIK